MHHDSFLGRVKRGLQSVGSVRAFMNGIARPPLVGGGRGNTKTASKHSGVFRTCGDQRANHMGYAGVFVQGDQIGGVATCGWQFNSSSHPCMNSQALNNGYA